MTPRGVVFGRSEQNRTRLRTEGLALQV